jgi:hypothetical protein
MSDAVGIAVEECEGKSVIDINRKNIYTNIVFFYNQLIIKKLCPIYMPCTISALLATVAIISMIYMNNAMNKSQTVQTYQKQLPVELKQLYHRITNERLKIYYMGYILGFLLSLIIIYYNQQIHPREKMTTLTMTTIVIAVSFVTNYFYYILSPKSEWMLDNIKTPQQSKAWLKMYRNMQIYYHSGLVLGIVGVALISIAYR